MAILGNIRKSGNTFVVMVVSFLVVMFLGSELARVIPYLFSSKDQIGRLSGEKISYVDYHKMYETICRNLASQGKQPKEADQLRLRDYAWRQLIERMLYRKELKQAGIAVGSQELVDLVQGEHIDTELRAAFKDPKTGDFDKQKLLNYLNNLSKSEQVWWCQVEQDLAQKRAVKKLHQLMVQSCFTTTLEVAHAAQQAGLFCKVDYLYIPFSSIQDDLVRLTNQQLRDYMAAHKNQYTALSALKTIHYIAFPVQQNKSDSDDFQKELNNLVVQFSTTTDPYAFSKQHTDGHLEDTRLVCTADTLPSAFTTIKHTLKAGMVVGPVVNDAFHTLYKLIKVEKGHYEIAVIEKKPLVSDQTRNKYFRQVQQLTDSVKGLADLEQLATHAHLTIQKETVAPSDGSIGPHAAARKVVCWLYNQATVGKVSPLFDLGNVYLLAVMVDQVKPGDLVPLDSVFRKVYAKVLHQEKAKIILDKLKCIKATTLQGIAEQYGEGLTIQSVERLCFLEKDDHQLKKAQVFVGKCFGLGLNVLSDPIIDDQGIFIACVSNKDTAAASAKHNDQTRQVERWIQPYYIGSAMEELAQVTDERYKVE
ncbi:SurA N-terminal domain/PPIC-type PPIASE domain protein [Cardinium endosymbiont of Sogatella furcifera]|uniref:SurA N-terminal domain-containing protein n=1 Tax=Cardinium endosymbiont of Sogatella furcifera TaxID=650378 RepID=UPI000E0D0BCD|nr:SurA N-terminal domain-containing protein [Cardinium endosymbiont of Sogatella furcifera]AXI24047.1 SurA N-terminal domain/PPIC-type PPIASE domain protein [Cardinium endosymbiont of Sogatella furcifera]